jgi:predicted FMN-binding regulatory protein PaiB
MVIVMFQPDAFRVEDVPEMHALMRGRPFAALVSAGAAALYASHLPMGRTASLNAILHVPIRIASISPWAARR